MFCEEELYTIVENTNPSDRVFGYLGAQGVRLAPGEVVALPGDLVATIYETGKRQFDGLERSLKRGSLKIHSRPAPLLWDSVFEKAQSIAIVAGVLGTVDACHANSQSSESGGGGPITGDALLAFFYSDSSMSSDEAYDFGVHSGSAMADFVVENIGAEPLVITEINIDG